MIKRIVSLIMAAAIMLQVITPEAKAVTGQTIREGVYIIKSCIDRGKVVDIAEGSKSAGAKMILYSRHGGPNQQFIVKYNRGTDDYVIVSRNSMLPIGADDVECVQGSCVEQQRYRMDTAQRWKIEPVGRNEYVVRLQAEARVLDVEWSRTDDFTQMQVWEANGTLAQRFEFERVGDVPASAYREIENRQREGSSPGQTVENGIYTIESVLQKGKVVDVAGGSKSLETRLIIWDNLNGENQKFLLEYDPRDGAYWIVAKHSHLPIGVPRERSWHENISQRNVELGGAQKWYIHRDRAGTYTFELKSNGLVMDVYGSKVQNGNTIWTHEKNGTNAQKFHLIREYPSPGEVDRQIAELVKQKAQEEKKTAELVKSIQALESTKAKISTEISSAERDEASSMKSLTEEQVSRRTTDDANTRMQGNLAKLTKEIEELRARHAQAQQANQLAERAKNASIEERRRVEGLVQETERELERAQNDRGAINKAKIECDGILQRIRDVKGEIERINQSHRDLKSEEAKAKLEQTRQELEISEAKLQSTKREVSEKISQLQKKLEEDHKKLEQSRETLKLLREKFQEETRNSAKVELEVQDAQQELAKARELLEFTKADSERKIREKEDLLNAEIEKLRLCEKSRNQAEKALEAVQKEKAQALNAISTLKELLGKLTKGFDAAQNAAKMAKDQALRELAELERKRDQLKLDLKQAQDAETLSRLKAEEMSKRKQEAEQKKKDKEKELALTQEECLGKINKARDELEKSRLELDAEVARKMQAQRRFQEAQRKNEEARKMLSEAQFERERLELQRLANEQKEQNLDRILAIVQEEQDKKKQEIEQMLQDLADDEKSSEMSEQNREKYEKNRQAIINYINEIFGDDEDITEDGFTLPESIEEMPDLDDMDDHFKLQKVHSGDDVSRSCEVAQITTVDDLKLFDPECEKYLKYVARIEQDVKNTRVLEKANAREKSLDGVSDTLADVFRKIYRSERVEKAFGTKLCPRTVQVYAALRLADATLNGSKKGILSQIKTGEGKSFIISAVAIVLSMYGRKVDIITSTNELANRDQETQEVLFDVFGITTGVWHEYDSDISRAIFDNQVVYSSYAIQYVYLEGIFGKQKRPDEVRPYDTVILDEVDNLLIDRAHSATRLTHPVCIAYQKELFKVVYKMRELSEDEVFSKISELFPGYEIQKSSVLELKSAAQRVEQLEEGVEYVKQGNKIRLLDVFTGAVESENTVLPNYVHEMLLIKEGLSFDNASMSYSEITQRDFYKMYKNIIGLTGTLGNERDREKLSQDYEADFFEVPRHLRTDVKVSYVEKPKSQAELFSKINEEIGKISPRPILVIFNTLKAEEAFRKYYGKEVGTIRGLNENTDKKSIATAGMPGAVTLATNMGGRGVDIKLTNDAVKLGGLHVILANIPINNRVENQAIGRAGRNGQPGTATVYGSKSAVSVQDAEDAEQTRNNLAKVRTFPLQWKFAEYMKKNYPWMKDAGTAYSFLNPFYPLNPPVRTVMNLFAHGISDMIALGFFKFDRKRAEATWWLLLVEAWSAFMSQSESVTDDEKLDKMYKDFLCELHKYVPENCASMEDALATIVKICRREKILQVCGNTGFPGGTMDDRLMTALNKYSDNEYNFKFYAGAVRECILQFKVYPKVWSEVKDLINKIDEMEDRLFPPPKIPVFDEKAEQTVLEDQNVFSYNPNLSRHANIAVGTPETLHIEDRKKLIILCLLPGTKKIPRGLLRGCTELMEVIIPTTVEEVDPEAFEDCKKIKFVKADPRWLSLLHKENVRAVIIPDGVTNVSMEAFAGCSGLTVLNIAKSVNHIESLAFADCKQLRQVVGDSKLARYFEQLNVNIWAIPDESYGIDEKALDECKSLEMVYVGEKLVMRKILEGYRIIGKFDKEGESLNLIQIADSVEQMEPDALENCKNLKRAIVNARLVKYLPKEKLEELELTKGTKKLCKGDLSGLWNLRRLKIKHCLLNVEDGAFAECPQVEELECAAEMLPCIVHKNKVKKLILSKETRRVTREYLKGFTELESVEFPDTDIIIEEDAFAECPKCKEKSICQVSYEIPVGTTKLTRNMFQNRKTLKTLKIPSSVVELDEDALVDLHYLTEVHCDSRWLSRFSCKNTIRRVIINKGESRIGKSDFDGYEYIDYLEIPRSVREISNEAFCGCGEIKRVSCEPRWLGYFPDEEKIIEYVVPCGETELEAKDIENLLSLEKLTIPESVRKIDEGILCRYGKLTSVYNGKKLIKVKIPSGVLILTRDFCKRYPDVISVEIPGTVQRCDFNAFEGSRGVRHVKCSLLSLNAFNKNEIESITVQDYVREIDQKAFVGRPYLRMIYIPTSVKIVSERAFDWCPRLKVSAKWKTINLEIPRDIVKITAESMAEYVNVRTLVIPETVTEIENGAFDSMKALHSVKCNAWWVNVLPKKNIVTLEITENSEILGAIGLTGFENL